MRKIKILMLFFLIVMLTGCSGNYNLKINEDLTVDEKVDFSIPVTDGAYENTLNLFKENKISQSKYKVTVSDDNIKILYKESYDSIEDYLLNDKIYKTIFNDVDYIKEKRTLRLAVDSKMKLDGKTSNFINNDFNISFLQINIETPFNIINNNADKMVKNKMVWTLNKDTTSKKIDFKIDIDKKSSSYSQILVLLIIGIIVLSSIIFVVFRFIKGRKI